MIAFLWFAMPCPLQGLAFSFRFGLLDHENLLRLASGVGSYLFALAALILSPSPTSPGVGNNVSHQHVYDLVAEGRHVGIQRLLLHRCGDRVTREANTSSRVMPGTWPRITWLHITLDLRHQVSDNNL